MLYSEKGLECNWQPESCCYLKACCITCLPGVKFRMSHCWWRLTLENVYVWVWVCDTNCCPSNVVGGQPHPQQLHPSIRKCLTQPEAASVPTGKGGMEEEEVWKITKIPPHHQSNRQTSQKHANTHTHTYREISTSLPGKAPGGCEKLMGRGKGLHINKPRFKRS